MERLNITHKDTRAPPRNDHKRGKCRSTVLLPFTLDAILQVSKHTEIGDNKKYCFSDKQSRHLFHNGRIFLLRKLFWSKTVGLDFVVEQKKNNCLHPHATTHFLEKEKLNKTHSRITAYTHKILTVHLAFSSQIPPEVISSSCYQKAKKNKVLKPNNENITNA